MNADAYRRARALVGPGRDGPVGRILGAVQSVLLLGLLVIACLFIALMASRGEARFPAAQEAELPSWVAHLGTGDGLFVRFRNTGIFPLVANNLLSRNPVHRLGARVLDRISGAIPPLRNNLGALATLLAVGLLFLLAITFLTQWRRRAMSRAATDLATTLRRQIHRQMYRLGDSSLPTEGIGPVVNIWTREVNDVREAYLADLNITPRTQILAAGLILIALFASPILTLFLGSLGLLVWITSRVLNRDARLAHDAALRDVSVQLCLLHEDLGLLRTVRIHGLESYDRQRFDEHLDRFRQADAERIATEPRMNPTTVLLYGSAVVIALGLLGYNILIRDHISIGTMLVLMASLAGLAVPISRWLKLRDLITQANRSASGIFEFLERSPELHQNVGAHFLAAVREQVSLRDLSLRSRTGKTLLSSVQVDFPAGMRTGILSLDEDSRLAMACLIPRLIDPQSGRILIDGHDLRDVTLESIRAQVGTVLQSDLVFTDSVLVNIGMGDPVNGLPRVIEAAKLAHAHHFILDLPHGYDTIIGPLGHYLKPDEQFRIALARTYLHDASVLIVEEPTVPVDEETQLLIDDTLARLAEGRTLILLPNRLSTIRSCDQLIVLHDGKVEDVGSPAQLEAESKIYRHLIYEKFNEFAGGEIASGHLGLNV
ncbi:Putative multidrug export ATP-binding/permease protein [Aquisphaera giovannonii]|uniref:Multidrug export ATP-binding/permease protein n=1 Tax=Aquisphaera giovannonii TaxID=406548 RepID=A0A5B9W938_9BACT|nr:ABC transporter ATP-binding protein [Aquisphaera giovannonii]QEH37118.1 Putative multidrug export ATP-binding/permease protein [Aquisphaera giovannonii]